MTRPEDSWPHVLQVMMAVMGVPHRLAWREGGLDPGARGFYCVKWMD